MMTTPPPPSVGHREEEYTDYSCSTAVERLSRDVETALRSWHVDNGSDHHVSSVFTTTTKTTAAAETTPGRRKNGSRHDNNVVDVLGAVDDGDGDDVRNIKLIRSKFIPWNLTINSNNSMDSRTSATTATTTTTLTVDLELALWDAPLSFHNPHLDGTETSTRNNSNDQTMDGEEEEKEEDEGTPMKTMGQQQERAQIQSKSPPPSNLVRSLRRSKQFGAMPTHGFLFDNFSTLFGIGQHITLTPVQPEPLPYPLMEVLVSLGQATGQEQATTAKWVWANLLSNWLQTALNVASSNCKCCLPTFGVWGQYRPNHLVFPEPTIPTTPLLTTANKEQKQKQEYKQSTARSSSSATLSSSHHQTSNGGDGTASAAVAASSSSRSGRSTSGNTATPDDGLVGKTIRTELDRRHSRLSSQNSSNENPLQNRSGAALLFPIWAQACKNIQLPPELVSRMRRRAVSSVVLSSSSGGGGGGGTTGEFATAWNSSQYAPPFFVGKVLAPFQLDYGPYACWDQDDDSYHYQYSNSSSSSSNNNVNSDDDKTNFPVLYRTGANMWVSAFETSVHGDDSNIRTSNNNRRRQRSFSRTSSTTSSSTSSAASMLVGRPRLSVWAGVLLQHCPDDTTVVLIGGRHVFGWFKERPNEPNRKGSSTAGGGSLLSSLARAATSNGVYGNGMLYRNDFSGIARWRLGAYEDEDSVPSSVDLTENFIRYRRECQEYAREILEEAWGCKDRRMPLWGSIDDPVASILATTTWNGKSNTSDNILEPLLSFPLRIRSKRELSRDDYTEMEDSIERSILDPMNPSRFCVQAFYDRDTSVSTLAANIRCVLAATIRAATLPDETLLHHLTDMDLIKQWDDASGRKVAKKLSERANIGSGTLCIVEAMDWSTSAEEFISLREAEYAVHNIMSSALTAGFPSCPDDSFNEHDYLFPLRKTAPVGRLLSSLFAHMARLRALSSVALVWRVFCHELRRRFDAKESLPNMQYVPGLDPHPLDLYEKRCFSTIGLKADFAAFLNCTEPDPDDFNCLVGQKLQVFNLGVECIVAQEMLESEALENFLGTGELPASLQVEQVDTKMKDGDVPSVEGTLGEVSESFQSDNNTGNKKKWPKATTVESKISNVDNEDEKTNFGPPTIDRDLDFWVMDDGGHNPAAGEMVSVEHENIDDTGFDYVAPPSSELRGDDGSDMDLNIINQKKKLKQSHNGGSKISRSGIVVDGLPDEKWEGTVMDGSERSSRSGGTLSQVYHDAAEAGSIFSATNGFLSMDTMINVPEKKRRPGARCPVQGEGLAMTGDQLYAPYLQRPYPVTDDVAMERRVMLAKSSENDDKRGILQTRLEIAQRLQRPKLLSDMCAFKAANPKCTLDDFTKWYGNPGNPLDEYNEDDTNGTMSVQDAYKESAARKLDNASEAMRVLVSTRDFWGKAWEEATPVSAAEQDPLFDYHGTVEMVLDYLEQLHPANLMNQVMAVNLSSAYFALASSAKGTMKIGIVQLSMKKLREKIEKAVDLLASDSTGSAPHAGVGRGNRDGSGSTTAASTTTSKFASVEAISACEDACNVLSVTETMVARATSLLDKFPGQYSLVSDLLRFADGSTLGLTSREGRVMLMNRIFEEQQKRRNVSTGNMKDGLPSPMLREYIFRNLNDDCPCQLAVRFGDKESSPDHGENEGGVLLALMTTHGQDDE